MNEFRLPLIPFAPWRALSALSACCALTLSLPAQEISPLPEARNAQKIKEVKSRQVIEENGQRLIIEQVEFEEALAPPAARSQAQAAEVSSATQAALRARAAQAAPAEPTHSFLVSAVVYDRGFSRVTWTTTDGTPQSFTAWSNINWSHLQGQHQLDSDWGKFSYILLTQEVSLKALQAQQDAGAELDLPTIPENLPRLRKSGARYLLTRGDDSHAPALDFMEAIHALYDAEGKQLARAQRQRKREHRRQQRLHRLRPPKKPDLYLRYGRLKNPTRNNEKK